MSEAAEQYPMELDRVIHEPARLLITSALKPTEGADFVFLQNLTGMTKGNLSSHLQKLQDADYVTVTKSGAGRRARTWVALTETGRDAIARHWQQLDTLRNMTE